MAVNALGQTIQLLLGQTPNNDLTLGLKAGDVTQGRLVDILPDNRAIIQINGSNMVAQLPAAQPGQAFVKGVLLNLAVVQAQPKPVGSTPSQPAGASPTPSSMLRDAWLQGSASGTSENGPGHMPSAALTLKFLGLAGPGANPSPELEQGIGQAPQALPQQSLEGLLAQAKLPSTAANLQAASSLSKYGLPVDSQTLHSVIGTAQALIQVETSSQASVNPASSQVVSSSLFQAASIGGTALTPLLMQSLGEAKTLLGVVATQPDRLSERPQIQSLVRQIDELLGQAPQTTPELVPKSQGGQAVAVTPQQELSQPDAFPSGNQSQAPLSQNSTPAQAAASLDAALNMLSEGRQNALGHVAQVISGFKEFLPSLQTAQALPAGNPAPATGAPLQSSSITPQALAPSGFQAAQPSPPGIASMQRELAAVLFQHLAPAMAQGGASQPDLMAALSKLAAAVAAPQSPLAEALLQSLANQGAPLALLPANQGVQALQDGLASIRTAFQAAPLRGLVTSAPALASEFEQRQIPASRISLSELPVEHVVEAVAFLKARQIPASRSAVEAVASQLNEGGGLGQQLNKILQTQETLPQGFLALQPRLSQEVQDLKTFLDQNAVDPAGGRVAAQIQDFVAKSGLNLESSLASLAFPVQEGNAEQGQPRALAQSQAQNPALTLKAGLLRLKDAVQETLLQPMAQASPALSGKLQQLLIHVESAVNAMHALQFAAKPTPAFDVTTLQLPISLAGQVQGGQLSIYWKKGKPHEIGGSDPVNVVFLLNTRALGDVKVQLQVWKSDCQCKVSVGSEEAGKFIEAEAPELRRGFSANTPFSLSKLDISTARPAQSGPLGLQAEAPARGASGLNLTA
jgi:hypothetical protein